MRTLKLGHHLTQGTADSNELWLELTAKSGGQIIGGSGAVDRNGQVDPWAYFFNVFMLDRHGRRIDRRNVQDIFVPLYDHQVPPGAAAVVHYELKIPSGLTAPVEVEARLQYRKFDRGFTRFALGETARTDIPVTTIATDRVEFPIARSGSSTKATSPIPLWERWNDYGIALLLEGSVGSEKGELRQASAAFAEVERLGRPDGPLNLARVFHKEGRLDEAVAALRRAATAGAPPWTVGWLSGLVNKENGHLDEAIANFESVLDASSPEMQKRGFDFSRDYEVINELGQTLFERAKMERDPSRADRRTALLARAAGGVRADAGDRQRKRRRPLRARPDLRFAGRSRTRGQSHDAARALQTGRKCARSRGGHRPRRESGGESRGAVDRDLSARSRGRRTDRPRRFDKGKPNKGKPQRLRSSEEQALKTSVALRLCGALGPRHTSAQ